MKNHWITLYNKKKNRWWAIEYSRKGMYLLKPRRVGIPSIKQVISGHTSAFTGIEVVFRLNQQANTDKELVAFLREARASMLNIYARLRWYEGFMTCKELAAYELTDLIYGNLSGGWTSSEVIFTFSFQHLRKI
jgi:hypothetical protein